MNLSNGVDILLTGSVAFDYLMRFPGYFREHILPDRLDKLSLSFLVESMVRRRGGTAPNIAYTMALLGAKPCVLATVGEDFTEYRSWLEAAGVDTRYMFEVAGEFTASFFVNTDRSNAQIASFYPGAMALAATRSLNDLDGPPPELVMISPNDPQAMDLFVVQCRDSAIPFIYDPSQQIVRLGSESLRKGVEGAWALFINDYEFKLIQNKTGMTEQDIQALVDFYVVTLGEQGALVGFSGSQVHIPVVEPREIIDPTGVGDAFRGGFLTGLSHGLDYPLCGQMGSLAATYCLENSGPQSHAYSPAEFVTRFREHFDDQRKMEVLLR